jgi:hypothetical protein
MIAQFARQLHWPSVMKALALTILLAVLIVVGSRNLKDFDSALVGYTFAVLFATFGIAYRYCVWLTKPPTQRYWRRGWALFFSLENWKGLRAPRILAGAVLSRIVVQDFVLRRGFWRWGGHMLIAWGCIIAAAITFPLVFGWIHFRTVEIDPVPIYGVMVFGFEVQRLPLTGVFSWFVFHGLVIASFLVIPGVMMAMYRRMSNQGAVAVQRFGRDLFPLIVLFLVAFSGLLLWISYEWMEGYYYSVLAHFHAITVIALLIMLPFGKLFHIFQRPASLGVALYRGLNRTREQARCPVTQEEFAPVMQTADLKEVLGEMDFDYSAKEATAPAWNEVSPKGRRMLIGRAHSRVRDGRFQ